MAKLDMKYAFDKYKKSLFALNDDEFEAFEEIADLVEKENYDYFDITPAAELSAEYDVDVTPNLKKCLNAYRIALAVMEYMQYDIAAKKN